MSSDKAVLFQQGGIPAIGDLIPLSLQHVVAAVVGIITPSIIVANTCGLTADERTMLVQAALIMSGLATLLQSQPLFGKLGSGLPVIMGSAFACVPTLTSIGAQFGIGAILGAELIGGVVAIVFALAFGMVNFDSIISESWVELPVIMPFEFQFVPSAIASVVIVFVVASVETIGNFTGASVGGLDREPTDAELRGGLVSQGVMTILGAFIFGKLTCQTITLTVFACSASGS